MNLGGQFVLSIHVEEERIVRFRYPDAWIKSLILHPQRVYRKDGELRHQRRVMRGRILLEAVIDDSVFPKVVVTIYEVH